MAKTRVIRGIPIKNGYAFARNLYIDQGVFFYNLDSKNSRANLVYGLFKLEQKDYAAAYKYLDKTVQLNKNPGDAAVARSKINELREKGWLS